MAVELLVSRLGIDALAAIPEKPWASDVEGVIYDSRFEAALDTVERWQNGNIYPAEGIRESDLGHIVAMQNLFDMEIAPSCPTLIQEVDRQDVHRLIRVHDAAEIVTGDLPCTETDPKLRRIKYRSESLAFTLMTRDLQDPAKTELRSLFHRYEVKDPADTNVMVTKWLDVIQGNHFAFEHGLYDTIPTQEAQYEHLVGRVVDLLTWTKALVIATESEQARQEVYRIAGTELDLFYDKGYGKYADVGIEVFVGKEEKNEKE